MWKFVILLLILTSDIEAEYFTISIDSEDIPTSDDWIDVYDFHDERPISERVTESDDDTLFKRPIYWFELDENGNLRIP